jgi:hypothetical protein
VSRIAPEVWTRLGSVPRGDSLVARLAAPEVTDRLAAALDAEGQRHLVIALQPGEAAHDDRESRGVEVATRDLALAGQPPERFIDIACCDAAGHDAFDLVGGELADRFAAGIEPPAQIVARVLAKWRRFWGQLPRQLLSREAQLGLFAELWFLSTWLLPRVGVPEAVTRWHGPFGARHDFEWPGGSVEVKASTAVRGPTHRINGIEQLDPPEQGELLFFSLRLREEAGATNTLPTLVAACRQQIGVDDATLTRFETTLAQAGYSQIHEEDYARVRLRVVTEALYVVHGDFPRLTPTQIANGVPGGIEQVEYDINLAGFDHLRVARAPAEAPAF